MRNAQAAESLQLEMCPLVQKLRVHMRGFRDVIVSLNELNRGSEAVRQVSSWEWLCLLRPEWLLFAGAEWR